MKSILLLIPREISLGLRRGKVHWIVRNVHRQTYANDFVDLKDHQCNGSWQNEKKTWITEYYQRKKVKISWSYNEGFKI